jgi:hypothetical protein
MKRRGREEYVIQSLEIFYFSKDVIELRVSHGRSVSNDSR